MDHPAFNSQHVGWTLGPLTCTNRETWSKHFTALSTQHPDEMKTIVSAICIIVLSDLEPSCESEQLRCGMFNDFQDIWADKSLTFYAFQNGAITSQSEVQY